MATLSVGDRSYEIHRLDANADRLPYTLRILLENVLRNGGDPAPIMGWAADAEPSYEISFMPARVLLQDFTGVPAFVDLAAMRDAMRDQDGDPERINPLIPAELVIDHSVQVDEFASRMAIGRNVELEFERNRERYAFLRWGQTAFDNFKVVPPNTGICHQVNLEYLGRVVEPRDVRLLPRRRRDAALPAHDRAAGDAHRPHRGLLQGEHALARPGRGAHLLAGRRPRPLVGRAEPRGAAPPAGPRPARAREGEVHR